MTTEERLANLELQLGRVKRRNRWLLVAILLISCGVLIPAVVEMTARRTGAPRWAYRWRTDVLRWEVVRAISVNANEFVLGDRDFKTRAVLNMSEEGPALNLSDENGVMRVLLGLWREGPRLYMADENGKARVILSVREGKPQISIFDENNTAIWRAIE